MSHNSALSRRRFLRLTGLAALGVTASACAFAAPGSPAASTPEPTVTTPDQALQRLLEGKTLSATTRLVTLAVGGGHRTVPLALAEYLAVWSGASTLLGAWSAFSVLRILVAPLVTSPAPPPTPPGSAPA